MLVLLQFCDTFFDGLDTVPGLELPGVYVDHAALALEKSLGEGLEGMWRKFRQAWGVTACVSRAVSMDCFHAACCLRK